MKIIMKQPAGKNTGGQSSGKVSSPPAKKKLSKALSRLLREKDFNSITTAEISKSAGANEALIYRYFKDKRGLLHHVLHDYLVLFIAEIQTDLKQTCGTINKLRHLIRAHIGMYDSNRVFAKILLLEVRNFPGYFESETYRLVKLYGQLLTDIILAGIDAGDIRDDIPSEKIRDLILGGIEHFCMAPVIFGHEIPVETVADQLGDLILNGITPKQ